MKPTPTKSQPSQTDRQGMVALEYLVEFPLLLLFLLGVVYLSDTYFNVGAILLFAYIVLRTTFDWIVIR